MIILTLEQKEVVEGVSNRYAGLFPVPLKDGNYILPERVLSDPNHSEKWAFLATLPTRVVNETELLSYQQE